MLICVCVCVCVFVFVQMLSMISHYLSFQDGFIHAAALWPATIVTCNRNDMEVRSVNIEPFSRSSGLQVFGLEAGNALVFNKHTGEMVVADMLNGWVIFSIS